MIHSNESYARTYNINVITGVVTDQAMVNIDSDRIVQVITNLLSNAIKFSFNKGTVTVAVHAFKDNMYRIMVSNQGKVIPPSEKQKLFSRFYQADSRDNRAKQFRF